MYFFRLRQRMILMLPLGGRRSGQSWWIHRWDWRGKSFWYHLETKVLVLMTSLMAPPIYSIISVMSETLVPWCFLCTSPQAWSEAQLPPLLVFDLLPDLPSTVGMRDYPRHQMEIQGFEEMKQVCFFADSVLEICCQLSTPVTCSVQELQRMIVWASWLHHRSQGTDVCLLLSCQGNDLFFCFAPRVPGRTATCR